MSKDYEVWITNVKKILEKRLLPPRKSRDMDDLDGSYYEPITELEMG